MSDVLRAPRTVHVRTATEADASAYRSFVDACPAALVQHSWEWRAVVSTEARDEPVYLLAADHRGDLVGVLPAFEYHGPHGPVLISVPHAGGYGGVVADPRHPDREEIHALLLRAFRSEAERRGCLLATIATAPFSDALPLHREYLRPDFERENFYQFIDLHEPATATTGSATRAHKYLRRAAQAKARFGLETTFTDSHAHFDAWYAIHEQRMATLGSLPLPRPFLKAIRRNVLAAGNGTMCYVTRNDAVVAGCMFVGRHEVLDCFMLSGSSAGAEWLATSVLVADALDWARAAGYRHFNWQSSSSRDSGVYHFKAKWGSREGRHHYLTKITGDISALRRVPIDVIRRDYAWHFVMPFDQFTPQP